MVEIQEIEQVIKMQKGLRSSCEKTGQPANLIKGLDLTIQLLNEVLNKRLEDANNP